MSTDTKTSIMPENVRRNWPELDRDQRSWELAKVALGPNATVSELAAKAQEFKQSLLSRTP